MTTLPFSAAHRVRFDLCDRCTMPRSDPHHAAGYRMDRSPYDVPGHAFVSPLDGFARPMTSRDYRRALAAVARAFARDLAAYGGAK